MIRKLTLIPSAMLLIWKNFLFGPKGKGRSKFILVLLIPFAAFHIFYMFQEGAKMDQEFRELKSGDFHFWVLGLFTAFLWLFVLPAAIYLIDLPKRTKMIGVISGDPEDPDGDVFVRFE